MQITLNDILFSFSRALDYVEQELLGITTNHGKRTALVSMRLGQAMGLPDTEVFDIASCAVLHDNALTTYMLETGYESFSRLENLKQHCPLGESNAASFPFLGDVSGVILYHHENWDGSGYYRLLGNAIPLRAAIIRLADNLDLALGMGVPRPELRHRIEEHTLRFTQSLYSPVVAEALLDIVNEAFIDSVSNENIDFVLAGTVPAVGKDLSSRELLEACRVFAAIIDAKSHFTQNHSAGVAAKARHMGRVFGLGEEHCDKLEVAALLHDVGKLATPLKILEKPGPLEPEEFQVMKNHAQVSWEILRGISGMEDITEWASGHHEKLNGTGYPLGNKAEKQGLESRLLTACDIFQALTEDRPYRKGMDRDAAAKVMRGMVAKGELDGDIVEAMLRELTEA